MDAKLAGTGLLKQRYRLTKQRGAVLHALGEGGHFSAEAILERARRELPGVSLGTIYRTLDILRDLGLVERFSHGAAATRYEASSEKHHHLLCRACGLLVNVQAAGLREIATELGRQARFEEIQETLTLVGRCAECARSAKTSGVWIGPDFPL